MKLIVTPAQLRRLMRKRKLSGAALARLAGTSQPTISRLTSGTTSSCRGDVGARIERALKESPGTLFGGHGQQSDSASTSAEASQVTSGDLVVPEVTTEPLVSETHGAAA